MMKSPRLLKQPQLSTLISLIYTNHSAKESTKQIQLSQILRLGLLTMDVMVITSAS